jgi:hypothetical protein
MMRLRPFGVVAVLVAFALDAGRVAAEQSGAAPVVNVVRFQGRGDRQLPTIRVQRGGTILHWKNRGAVFTLFNEHGIVLDSVAARGSHFLSGGRQRLYVIEEGRGWTLTIPKAVRVRTPAATTVAQASTLRTPTGSSLP